MHTDKTKSNKTKASFRCLGHHLERKWIGPMLQLSNLQGSRHICITIVENQQWVRV